MIIVANCFRYNLLFAMHIFDMTTFRYKDLIYSIELSAMRGRCFLRSRFFAMKSFATAFVVMNLFVIIMFDKLFSLL